MKELVPMNDYGIFCDTQDTARVDSRYVAEAFGKRHDHVLRDIENLLEKDIPKSGGISADEFGERNFASSSYKDDMNRKQRCYVMTRDGFTLLAMGFTGKKATAFKIAYIKRFNEMERTIKALVAARMEFPLLTANITMIHDEPKPYHYSNECDMLNRLAIGMTARQFREAHGLSKGESIRPHLTAEQIELVDMLQMIDAGLLISTPDFQQRKRHLEWFIAKRAAA